MSDPRRRDSTPVLWIGLGGLLILGLVTFMGWALGVQQLPLDGTVTGNPAEQFGDLVGGTNQDTTRVVHLGELAAVVDESSGVAVSARFPGVLWTHNDGTDARLFAVSRDGTLVSTVPLTGVQLEDWEDLAAAPCPGTSSEEASCLFIADTGDNEAQRPSYAVVVVPEPDPRSPQPVGPYRRIRFRYPGGPVDTEGLAVTPAGDLLLVTKGNDGSSRLYRLPVGEEGDQAVRTAELVGTLAIDVSSIRDRITAAAVSPDGARLAVRNHHAVYLVSLNRPLGAPILCEIGIPQPQGEGLDFLEQDLLILTSERDAGHAPLVRLRCP